MRKYITTKQVLIDRILHESVFISQSYEYFVNNNENHFLVRSIYNNFDYLEFDNGMIMFEFDDNSPLIKYEDLFDVTDNDKFSIDSIYNGYVKQSNLILEGADGSGKTTISRSLALDYGILSQDRNVKGITKHISNNISIDVRYDIIKRFIAQNQDKEIFFLYLSNVEEMIKRVFTRDRVSEYDLHALESREKYIKLGIMFQNEFSNFHLYDVFGKTLQEELDYIISFVDDKPKGLVRK